MTDKLTKLAQKHGRNFEDVLEYWHERAAVREYDGGQSRLDADRDALVDVERWLKAGRP